MGNAAVRVSSVVRRFVIPFMTIVLSIFIISVLTSFAQEKIKIGAAYPLTGGVAEAASYDVEGIKLAVEEINAKGGLIVQGKKYEIELILYDTKCDPTQGAAAVEKMIHQDKVVAISGDYCSHSSFAEREISNKNGVIQIVVGIHPKITEPGYPYIFRTCSEANDLARAFAEFLDRKLKIKSLAFLVVSDDYGRGNVEAYKTFLKDSGVKIVAVEYFKHGDTDFYTQITKILALKPDAIYVTSSEDAQSIGTLKQIRELGFKGHFLGSSSYGTVNTVKLGGKELLEGMYLESPFIELIEDQATFKAWQERYKKRWGREPNMMSVTGHQTIDCIAAAIRKANSLERDKIRDAMFKIDLRKELLGFVGKPYFDETGQVSITLGAVQWKNGKMVIVYKQEGAGQ